ncbi:MAG: hypothetical protein JJ992_13065 [Planctomycetes bacterium]|nr:hypothetical protein [Planctomycetota bacterium]
MDRSPRIRPSITLREVYGDDCVFNGRASYSSYGWLPTEPAILDALTGSTLAVAGGLPAIRSRGVTTERGCDLLVQAGLPVDDASLVYASRDEYLQRLAEAPDSGRKIVFSHLHPPQEISHDVYWIDATLLSFLNNKANLPALVSEGSIPKRRVISASGIARQGTPVVIKVADDLSNGAGFAVRLCHHQDDLLAAQRDFRTCDRVVAEEYLAIDRNLCVNFATVGREVVHLGTAEQIVTPSGAYAGNWLVPPDDLPQRAIDLGRGIMEQAAGRGYRGLAGFDIAVLRDGRLLVLDLNFRINGCTPSLLLYEHARSVLKFPLGCLRTWRGRAGSFLDIYRVFSEAVADRYFLPLCVYEPAAGGNPEGVPSVSGLVFGATRVEVEAKLRYLHERMSHSVSAARPRRAVAA